MGVVVAISFPIMKASPVAPDHCPRMEGSWKVRAGGNVPHGRSKSVVKSKHLAPFRPHPACFSVSLGAHLDAWKNPTSPA